MVPFAVLGLRDNENLFVTQRWPVARERVHPGVRASLSVHLLEVPNTDRLVLCVDEAAEQYESPSTQPFFVDGKPSENLQRALQFSEQFHAQLDETRRFCTWLEENGMLEEKVARADMANGQSFTMRGFRVLSSEKMNTLTDVQILELHKKGWLALLYFHLQSQQHWPTLSRMVPSDCGGCVAVEETFANAASVALRISRIDSAGQWPRVPRKRGSGPGRVRTSSMRRYTYSFA